MMVPARCDRLSCAGRAGGRPGFTRTDLLACIAVASVVGAVAVAVLLHRRDRAHVEQCVANLREIAKALTSFSNEHEGRLPDIVPGRNENLWWWYKEQVKGYAGLTGPSQPGDRVFACPNDRGYTDPQPFFTSARFDYGSYVFNGVTMPGVPNIAGREISSIREPRRTLLVMEWTAHAPLSWHKSRTGRRNAPFYSDAESVAGFIDGHIALTRIYYDGYNAAYTQDPIPGYDYKYSGD